MYIKFESGQVFYQTFGKGMPLILIHGLPFDGSIWTNIVPALSKHFQVIVVDLPNFGKSKNSQFDSLEFADLKEAIYALILHLNIRKAIILGHSFGGYVALDFFKKYKEIVNKIILVSTTVFSDSLAKKNERKYFALQLGSKNYGAYITLQKKNCSCNTKWQAYVDKVIGNNVHSGIAQILLSAAERSTNIALLKNTSIQILFIVGEEDDIFLSETYKMKELIPHSKLAIVKNARHMVFLDNQHACISLLKKSGS